MLAISLLGQVLLVRTDSSEEDEEPEAVVKEEEDVLVLTDDNFDEVIYSRDTILVEFYAPWCGHCKSLAPEYAKAAKRLKANDPPVSLGKVDATVHEKVTSRFDVNGYPTLMFFKKGKMHPYDGPREENGIVKYMEERASANWKPPPEAVVTLDQKNFDEFINKHELSLVEFYAPWCGHCKRLAPAYEKAAKTLLKNDPPIPLAKLDATAHSKIGEKYDINGYPTLKIFRKGVHYEYKGPTEEYGIVNHMISQHGDASKLVNHLKDLRKSLKVDAISVVGFFKNISDPIFTTYMDAANDLRDEHHFIHTTDPDIARVYKVDINSIAVFIPERFQTQFEPKMHVLKKATITRDDIIKFVEIKQFPLVGHYNFNTEKKYNKMSPLCLVIYSVDFSHDHKKATQLWRNKIARIAAEYREITFAIVNEEDYPNLMGDFGFDDSGEEMNIGILTGTKRFSMEPMEEFDSGEVRKFLSDFRGYKLKPHIKSQPVPKKQKGPVTVVVAKNFDKIVMDKTKDVLIEFYAPWCGHCQKLEPKYNKLARAMQKYPNIVVAKMDATANDVPTEFKVEGFPSIFFAPSNNKKNPLKYDGDREIKAFSKFIREHATVPMASEEL